MGAAHLDDVGRWRYQPPAVLGAAQQGSETGGAVKTWPAQPVERTVAPDQRSRLAISDQRVILDPGGHGCICGPTFVSHHATAILEGGDGRPLDQDPRPPECR